MLRLAEPAVIGGLDNGLQVQNVGHLSADHSGAEHPLALRRLAHRDSLLHDIQNLVDQDSDPALAVAKDDDLDGVRDLDRLVGFPLENRCQGDQRQDLSAVLHYPPPTRALDPGFCKLLQPGD